MHPARAKRILARARHRHLVRTQRAHRPPGFYELAVHYQRSGGPCGCGEHVFGRPGWHPIHVAEKIEALIVERERAAAERALREVAADLYRNHDMPPKKDARSYSYRNGWWDGVHHAAKVAERAARDGVAVKP